MKRSLVLGLLMFTAAACGSTASTESESEDSQRTSAEVATTSLSEEGGDVSPTETSTFEIDVWADNWFALHVNGEVVGEDSVPITTERSFNQETFTFEASYPLTIAIEAKDFKENDSGLEYIGEANQQMGDGGIIAQIIDKGTGEAIAVTDDTWSALVIHRAPLNPDCERAADPVSTCESEILDTPSGWTEVGYDDSGWDTATQWTEAEVSPKDGYDQISWDPSAELIWGSDLEVDNTILLRLSVAGATDGSDQEAEALEADDEPDDLVEEGTGGEQMAITSPAVVDGALLAAFACERKDDGVKASIPLAWSGVSTDAGSLAITMHHFPNPDDTTQANSYLTLWDIDPSVGEIAHGEAGEGGWFQGSNKDGTAISYTSPCSPDPDRTHEYTITLYTLSETPPSLPQQNSIAIDWAVLVESLESVTIIDSATLTFSA
ncbi:MAG: hypothetical protein GY925_10420 [Actinomycetia bacterium]|nr:hypothetical protein [Actinomycetes bacterium]